MQQKTSGCGTGMPSFMGNFIQYNIMNMKHRPAMGKSIKNKHDLRLQRRQMHTLQTENT